MDELKLLLRKIEREKLAREQAEQLLESLSEELFDSVKRTEKAEKRLQYAMDNIVDGILVFDDTKVVTLVNAQFNNIFKYYIEPIKIGDHINHQLNEIIENPAFPSASDSNEQAVFESYLPNGCWVITKVNKTDDNIWILLFNDITWRKNNELERSKLLRKLYHAQKQEAIGKMASVIAHDFNNILGAINGFSNFLLEDLDSSSEQYLFAAKINKSVERGKEIIQNLSEFNYNKQSEHNLLHLKDIISESVSMIQSSLDSPIDLSIHETEHDIIVDGNKSELIRLFSNLISNAKDACNPDNMDINISIDALDKFNSKTDNCLSNHPYDDHKINSAIAGLEEILSQCVRITIKDNGCGMSQEVLDQAFEPYFTTKEKGKGTGLGMYSALDIVSDHAGTICIFSIEGVGTYCEVILPITASKLTHIPNQASYEGPKVMLVDDDESHLEYLSVLLSRIGQSNVTYNNPQEALQAYIDSPKNWKCIISDYMMPGLKGTELMMSIREQNTTIPLVLCSGYIKQEGLDMLERLDCMAVLKKPIDKGQLIDIFSKIR